MSNPTVNRKLGSFNKILAKLPQPPGSLSVLDVGCGFGDQLQWFRSDSVGLELGDEQLARCREKGLTVYKWSFLDPLPHELEGRRFDAALLSHFLEHVFSPHAILMQVRKHLKPDGLICINCPIVNPLDGLFLKLGRRYNLQKGFHTPLFGDHVNFFTTKTLRLTCEFAGFRTLYLGTPYLPYLLSRCLRDLWPTAWYIGSKMESFQYNHESVKFLDEEGNLVWKR
jgi:SAM-dependent methyltransferase